MEIRDLKNKLIAFIIVALLANESVFAGQFITDGVVSRYIDDSGKFVTGWRWIDTNNDGICECYRFNDEGILATKSKVKGKEVNAEGKWVIDGVVQQIYRATGRPLYSTNRDFGAKDTNKYIDFGTESNATKRINATKKDIKALMELDARKDSEARKKNLNGPVGTFEEPDVGYVLSKSVKSIRKKVPIATKSEWLLIDDATKEDAIRYLSASESIVAGRDMRNFLSASNKYTKSANNVKIYGGGVWNDVIILQGNGAYAKFNTTEDKTNFKANYVTFEIAHQTHGESTADTYCAIELYLNGKSITTYDDFCDGEPELIEEYLDEGEKNIELRAIVTGDAPGRKIYIRNARFRQIKDEETRAAEKEARRAKREAKKNASKK